MKNTKYIIAALFGATVMVGCDDFFSPETADSLSGDDYMKDLNEMATGYLGVLTKMQAVGDKEILLTETRGEMLEPTHNTTAELIALYNYADDLTGNSYADPAPYYDVVIACNDYIENMLTFKANYPELIEQTEYYDGLLASALRVKVWAYMTIGEIYGQAIWFDDPIIKMQDVTNPTIFTRMNMEQLTARCVDMIDNGYKGHSARDNFSWIGWVDAQNIANIANSAYRFWDQMTPPYEALTAKCHIWNAAYKVRRGEDASADYQAVCDALLPYLDKQWNANTHYWKRAGRTSGVLSSIYDNKTPHQEESVSAIIYDYTNNQTNRLLYHFSDEYPNAFLLTTNEAARLRFEDNDFDPLGTQTVDQRLGRVTRQHGDVWYVSKFRPVGSSVRAEAYQDDVHIYTFRAAELFLWLAESLNHLNRFEALNRIINQGFTSGDYEMLVNLSEGSLDLVTDEQRFEFDGFAPMWACPSSTDRYGMYTGFRTCLTLGDVDVWNVKSKHTLDEIHRHNDELIRNEWVLEFPAEGKTYPTLCRFAEMYADPTLVSDIVTLKYEAEGMNALIAGKICSASPVTGLPGYWVPWKL